MFETLFSYPAVLRRHRDGPLAAERAAYLARLTASGAARGTLCQRAAYCLCLARELEKWPPDHHFSGADLTALIASWAAAQVAKGRASAPRWPEQNFRWVAADFLRMLGRLTPDPVPAPGRYEAHVEDFIAAQRQRGWLSEASCRIGRWQVVKFLAHLDNQAVSLESLCPTHVDTYFQHQAQRWSRASLHTAGKILRAWFRHCEDRGWVQPGLAASILLPRLYRDEGLPPGPTWDQIARVLAETTGQEPAQVRDHAIVLLLAVYGLRSGELLRLCLEDIDWQHDRLRVVRSKSLREERLPLNPAVGNALARYLRHGRPRSASRSVFLTLRAPYRALSTPGLYGVVARRLARVGAPHKGRGPHGLRHACARHLREAGLSFKQIGDHLGHRSPDATRLYAKVDLASLRLVAFEDLGGLT